MRPSHQSAEGQMTDEIERPGSHSGECHDGTSASAEKSEEELTD